MVLFFVFWSMFTVRIVMNFSDREMPWIEWGLYGVLRLASTFLSHFYDGAGQRIFGGRLKRCGRACFAKNI